MPDSTVLFPTTQLAPSIMGGQIFAIHLPKPQRTREPLEELATVPTTDLNPLQRQILTELFVFQHATADLLLRKLRLSPNSLRYLQKQIYALRAKNPEDRFVEFIYPPKQTASRFGGSSPYVLTLGRKGYAYLRQQGVDVGRYRASEAWVHKEFPLRHRLAVNEFLLKAQLLETEQAPVVLDTQITLIKSLHEKYWNANPLRVLTPDTDKPVGLSPDLLTAFATQNPRDQYWLLPEINLSEPWRKDWEAKVRLYRYCLPAYRERLGTTVLTTIPVMVASSSAFPRQVYSTLTETDRKEQQLEAVRREKRMFSLRKWTEVALERLNLRHEADLFSFSATPLTELTPTELFFGKHLIIPFSDTPRPLIQTGKDGGY
jgi:hypothetical protein